MISRVTRTRLPLPTVPRRLVCVLKGHDLWYPAGPLAVYVGCRRCENEWGTRPL